MDPAPVRVTLEVGALEAGAEVTGAEVTGGAAVVDEAVVEHPVIIIDNTREIAMTRTDHLLVSFFNKSITPPFSVYFFGFSCPVQT